MRSWWIALVSAALCVAPAVAATDIPAKPGKSWKHKSTGSQFPPALAGLKRTKVAYFSAPEVDVAANYWSDDGNDTITVYLYRNITGDVPLWFDRSRYFIMNLPDKYGEVKPSGIRPFLPRGQSMPSGLLETYETGKDARSTALAVLPFKDFYAKVRVSSKARDLAGIEALLIEAVNAFDWSSQASEPAAVAVADCSTPLAARAPAQRIEGSNGDRMRAGLLGGLFAQVTAAEPDAKDAAEPKPTFCREPGESTLSYGLYRANGDTERYMLAVLDGGRAIAVGRNGLSELVNSEIAEADGKPTGPARFTVSFVQLDKTETYGDFSSLPLPAQAVEEVEKTRPVSVAGTWGKEDKHVTIMTE